MRKLILSMQMSLDGFIEGPAGDPSDIVIDSDEDWDDLFDFLKSVDTFLLGRVMYPDYENYWSAALKNPTARKNEIKYAELAIKTQHIVFSKTMEKANWKNTIINKGNAEEEVLKLKNAPGKDIEIVGGATLASSLISSGLVDEYRILVNPIILGGGKHLFKDLIGKHKLYLTKAKTFKTGVVALHYTAA